MTSLCPKAACQSLRRAFIATCPDIATCARASGARSAGAQAAFLDLAPAEGAKGLTVKRSQSRMVNSSLWACE